MQKDKGKPKTGVMPMSRELLSISLPLSALKKLCHSPQRESLPRAILFHVTNISCPWQAIPALGRKSWWRTNCLQEMKAESAGLGQWSLHGPKSLM